MNPNSRTAQRWVLALTATASFMVALDLLVVSTALTTIRLDLRAPIEHVQWTVTAYGLSFAGLLMTGAALGDRYGRRRVFTMGLAMFAAASAGCALSPTVEWLVAARTVQGAGAALVMPLALALLSAAFPSESRGRALGLFEGLTGLATIAGPPAGGAIAHLLGWQWIFWVNVPIAAVVIVLVRRRVDESHGSDAALDIPGLILVTGGALGLVWALVLGNDAGWTSPHILAALGAGVALLIGFVAWESRAIAPMLPMRLFGSRAFSAGTVASVLLFASLYGSVFFLAQFMQTGLGYTALETGIRLIPWTVTLFVVAPLAGGLADRLGNRPVVAGGLAVQTAGLAWVALVAAPGLSYPLLATALVVTGVGTSAALPVVQNVVLGAVGPSDVGKASGANSTTQELGGVFGVAILVAVFTAAGSYSSAPSFIDGFAAAIGLCAVLAGAATLAALFVPPRDRATPSQDDPAGSRAQVPC